MALTNVPPMKPLIALALAAGAAVAAAQQPAERQTFRSEREVLSIEASVRDKAGRPVTDLQPSDFTVRVDGRERAVLTSRLYGPAASAADAGPAPAAGPIANVDRPAGRAVVVAVDRDSIRPGGERAVLEAVARLAEELSPADAVAVAPLPGVVTDFTRDHARVAAAIRRVTGTQPPPDTRHFLTWDEAGAYDRKDSITIQSARARECITGGQACFDELSVQAHAMRLEGLAHAEDMLRSVTTLVESLAVISAPKRIVLMSAGIPFDEELLGRYRRLAEKAAQSHVTLLIVQLNQSDVDTSSRGPMPQVYGGREHALGLATIASITGGQFFSTAGNAKGVFDRIAADISTFYELGVESLPSDANGKPHKVDVKVARAGVTVTAPAATAAPPRPNRSQAETLRAALAEPTDVTELSLEVATYVTHSTEPGKVRIVVAAGSRDPTQAPPTTWGGIVVDGDNILGGVGGKVDAAEAPPWSTSGTIDVPPGRYRLRIAIVAGDRLGTLELPLAAGLRAVGDARASDLIVGVVAGGQLQPAGRFSQAARARALVEMSSSAPLTDLGGYVILSPAGSAAQVLRAPLAFHARADDRGVMVGEAALDLTALAPGRYVAMASLERSGKAVGRVSRVLEVQK